MSIYWDKVIDGTHLMSFLWSYLEINGEFREFCWLAGPDLVNA